MSAIEQTTEQTIATTIKRGRGRPASFPDQETKAFLTTVPVDTIGQLKEMAEKWGLNLNQAIARVAERAHKDAFRIRSK